MYNTAILHDQDIDLALITCGQTTSATFMHAYSQSVATIIRRLLTQPLKAFGAIPL